MSWIMRIWCKVCNKQVKIEMPVDIKKCPNCGGGI